MEIVETLIRKKKMKTNQFVTACLILFVCCFMIACNDNSSSNTPNNPIDTTKALDTFSLKAWQGYCFERKLKIDGGDSLTSASDVWLNSYSIGGTLGVGIYTDLTTKNERKLKYFESKPDLTLIDLSDIEGWVCYHLRPDTTVGAYYIIQGKNSGFYQIHLDSIKDTHYMPFDIYYFSWQKVIIN